ncbi:cobaltochelatase [Alcanivorax xiamenensis]|uniref:Cobaltochelatase n=1 Tax=Alcanivorax xiamenensis TaxID=1177156 RepID=A0ABQ6YDQ7_9GAMM|nr:cobaltochelatase subunit CobN [Alcanivorax xiamenensis]KAF0808140.1 cobaltochelatase [Alcanivorax xiamenensis]
MMTWQRTPVSLLMVLGSLLVTVTAWADTPRIGLVYDGGESTGAGEILRAAQGLDDRATVIVYASGDGGHSLDQAGIEAELAGLDLLFVDGDSDNARTHARLLRRAGEHTRLVVVSPGADLNGNVDVHQHPDLTGYWRMPSQVNYRGLIAYLAVLAGGNDGAPVPAPRSYPEQGFYRPGEPDLFADWRSYQRAGAEVDEATPRIGILFHRNHYLQEDLAGVDALIEAVRVEGGEPVALAGTGDARLDLLLDDQGIPRVDAVIFQGTVLDRDDLNQGIERARALGVPVLSALHIRHQSGEAYRQSAHGLAPRNSGDIARGERAGIFEPLAVSAAGERGFGRRDVLPMVEQTRWRAARAVAWAHLHRRANAEKKVVFTFWSESGGKADLGADPDDFLDVPGTLIEVLKAMKARGYDLGDAPLPSRDQLSRQLVDEASNIGGWAPASIQQRAARTDAIRVPLARYQEWFGALPARLRERMGSVWGAPPGNVMVAGDGDERVLLLPALRFGNILIAAHPAWGYLENDAALKSPDALPPHHQYAAFFLWLRNDFKADAWVSLFSNIVLQPGKSEGPLVDDAIGQLLGATPHIHPERLGGAGGLANKRKALALTPGWYNLVVPTGELTTLTTLKTLLQRYDDLVGHDQLRSGARRAIRDEVAALGLDRALSWDASNVPFERLREEVVGHIANLEQQSMPYGTRVLGRAPTGDALAGMVTAMLTGNGQELLPPALLDAALNGANEKALIAANDGPLSDTRRQTVQQARDYADGLRGAPREVSAILDALEGRWIEPGPMFSPLRRADSLPVGRNLYTFDPAIMPTPEAEATGWQLAEDTVATFQEKHQGQPPKHLAFVLFSSETTRNQGVNEAHILALLGVHVERDSQGRVSGLRRLSREQLGRPRVDVTVTASGTYRDHYAGLMDLIDRAVRLAAAAPEDDNPVAASSRQRAERLKASGASASEADALSTARVFSAAPGAYSPNIQFLARSGDHRGGQADMAALYRDRMGHVYGGGRDGDAMPALFSDTVKDLQGAVLPRSSDVNGMLDHPMSAAFLGGLDMAARAAGGQGAELYVSRPERAGGGSLQSAAKAVQEELFTRYFNPRWIQRMQDHGYDGARAFMFLTDQLDLWNSTTDQVVGSADWAKVKAVYVDDEYGLDMRDFLDRHNPYAEQGLLANLLGAAERGQWDASDADKRQVATRLVESALAHGSACNANLCRNETLTRSIEVALEQAPGGKALARRYRQAVRMATGTAPALTAASPGRSGGAPAEVTGRVMETVARPAVSANTVGQPATMLFLGGALLLIGLGFCLEWRRR